MLSLLPNGGREYAERFEMPAHSGRLDHTMAAGSLRLQVLLQPIVFEAIRKSWHQAAMAAPKSQARRAKRLSKTAERMPTYSPFALSLEVILSEDDPAVSSEGKLFEKLQEQAAIASTMYPLK